jgi:Xaa-Pro aminopeptidase
MPVVAWPLTVFVELHRGLSGLRVRCTGSHPQVELWDGAMTEVADVPSIYGVDSSESMEHLTAVLQAEIASSDTVFLEPRKAFPQSTRFMVNKVVTDTVVKKLGGTVSGLNRQVDSLRAVKSEAEVALLSTACQQATEAIHMGLCFAVLLLCCRVFWFPCCCSLALLCCCKPT